MTEERVRLAFVLFLLLLATIAVATHAGETSTETCADCGPEHPHAR